jgi:hypothetical protein
MILYAYMALGLVISTGIVFSPLKRWAKYIETVFHELGHAFVGIVLGKKLKGFKLYADTSGETVTMSNGYGFRGMLTQLAGYPAPIVFATSILFLTVRGFSVQIMFGLIFVSCFMFLFVRNVFAVIPLATVFAIGAGSLYLKNDSFTIIFSSALAGLLLFLGVESLRKLNKYRPQGSDATMLGGYIGGSEGFWIGTMMFLSLVNAFVFPLLINLVLSSFNKI